MPERELKPCPFCGHQPPGVSDGSNGLHFRVICGKGACRAAGPLERCAIDAVDAWNTRTSTATPSDEGWRPIESAPKGVVTECDGSQYGPYILAVTDYGDVRRVRWWQSADGTERFRNFLGDCGNAYHPTHWMPLPDPPSQQ